MTFWVMLAAGLGLFVLVVMIANDVGWFSLAYWQRLMKFRRYKAMYLRFGYNNWGARAKAHEALLKEARQAEREYEEEKKIVDNILK